jgi:hypothetical protein
MRERPRTCGHYTKVLQDGVEDKVTRVIPACGAGQGGVFHSMVLIRLWEVETRRLALRGDFEHSSARVGAAAVSRAVEMAGGIEDQAGLRVLSIVAVVAKIM